MKDSYPFQAYESHSYHLVIMQLIPERHLDRLLLSRSLFWTFSTFIFQKELKIPWGLLKSIHTAECASSCAFDNEWSVCTGWALWCYVNSSAAVHSETHKESMKATYWDGFATPLIVLLKERDIFIHISVFLCWATKELQGKVLTNILEEEVESGWGKDWKGRGKRNRERGLVSWNQWLRHLLLLRW